MPDIGLRRRTGFDNVANSTSDIAVTTVSAAAASGGRDEEHSSTAAEPYLSYSSPPPIYDEVMSNSQTVSHLECSNPPDYDHALELSAQETSSPALAGRARE